MSVLIEKPVIATDFQKVRSHTEDLCSPLQIEDYQIQPMADASPPKWHLAHVTWFFETFVLAKYSRNYRVLNPAYNYLFNSYYNGVGSPYPRASRGHLSRPTVAEIYEYRKIIDERIVLLNSSKISNLNGKVVLIENADPGYDWIFSYNIRGLVTKYGGVASHMAIRCAEFDIPAAIGCGVLKFDKLKNSKRILLDCKNCNIKSVL